MHTLVSYIVKAIPEGWDMTVYIDGVEFSNRGPFSDWDDAWEAGLSEQEAVTKAIRAELSL